MNEFIGRTANIAMTLSLGLWVGALAGFAFFFAPLAFAAMGPTPHFAAMIASIIERLTDFGYVCAIAAIAGVLAALRRSVRRSLIAIAAIVMLMAGLSWFEAAEIVPQMRVTPVATPAYAGLHHRSGTVYGSIFILGLLALGITGARTR